MSRRAAVIDHPAAPPEPRRPVLLGVSLKLYLDIARTREWALAVADLAQAHPALQDGRVRLFALPSLPALEVTRQALAPTAAAWGAQDLHWEDRGAFTGAVSGADLAALGCRYVEIGHAERKRVFGESAETVGRKLAAGFRNTLTPVLCVGEAVASSPQEAAEACIAELADALSYAHAPAGELVVAYEPEWAIGQAEPAAATYVREVAQRLRTWLDENCAGLETFVIYGGSAQRGTLTDLGDSVDGLFLGRFAHRIEDLAGIIDEAAGI